MAFIPGTLVKADDALNRAVKNALTESFYKVGERKEPGYHRSALNSPVASGGGAAAAGYQGYFTIVDASDDDGPKVKVTDPRVEASELVLMPCKVNSSRFTLQEWTSDELETGTTWIYLHFNAGSEASGTVGTPGYTPAVPSSVVIEASDEELYDEGPHVYYQLGRVKYSSGEIAIYQDHSSGIPQIIWISSWCPGDDEEEEAE